MTWLYFAIMTVSFWGLYGVLLHSGQAAMGTDENARFRAFFFVGIAYFLVAIIGPLILLTLKGAVWHLPSKGVVLSLAAGTVGAIGALGILLSFAAGGKPAVVMSMVFAGAPILNAFVAMALHPPEGGLATIKPQFYAGIALAALGGGLVTIYKPGPSKPKAPASIVDESPANPAAPDPDSDR